MTFDAKDFLSQDLVKNYRVVIGLQAKVSGIEVPGLFYQVFCKKKEEKKGTSVFLIGL